MPKLAPNTKARIDPEEAKEDESFTAPVGIETVEPEAPSDAFSENVAGTIGTTELIPTTAEEYQAPTSEDIALLKDVPSAPLVPFEYNNRTAESYSRQGFKIPDKHGKDCQETVFLSKIRPNEWDKIQRSITKMVRVLAIDYEDPKLTRKEFIYWYENWYLPFDEKNPRTDEVAPVADHVEGRYEEQEKKPLPPVGGRMTGYKRTGEHSIHYIRFTKDAVDEAISKSVGTDSDNIIFCVKNGPVRDDKFSYEQFVNLPFQKCMELIRIPGGEQMKPYVPA